MNKEIDYFQIVVNEYWMYDGEPFHVIRYKTNGKNYACGLESNVLVPSCPSLEFLTSGGVYNLPLAEHLESLELACAKNEK